MVAFPQTVGHNPKRNLPEIETIRSLLALIDVLNFASLWAAAAGFAMAGANLRLLGEPASPRLLGLVFFGTLCIYNLDRLRDVAQDESTSPLRSAFIREHHASLTRLAIGSGVLSGILAFSLGGRVVVLAGLLLLVGFAHRRLKRIPFAKGLYLTAAWLIAVVGLPLVLASGENSQSSQTTQTLQMGLWIAAILGPAIFANITSASIRDSEDGTEVVGFQRALVAAQSIALFGVALGCFAPLPMRLLAATPLATLAVLIPFHPNEHYSLFVVDGALIASSCLVWLMA